ncbi:MAG: hypothetical protein Q9174_006933 [Haloplaca sp. 1 TL-2023]
MPGRYFPPESADDLVLCVLYTYQKERRITFRKFSEYYRDTAGLDYAPHIWRNRFEDFFTERYLLRDQQGEGRNPILKFALDMPRLKTKNWEEANSRSIEGREKMARIEDHFTENGQFRQETPDERQQQDELIAASLPSIKTVEKEFFVEYNRWEVIKILENEGVTMWSMFSAINGVNGNH